MIFRIVIRPLRRSFAYQPSCHQISSQSDVPFSARVWHPSLASTSAENCAKFHSNLVQFAPSQVVRRLRTFTYADWSDYLAIVTVNNKNGVLLPLREGTAVQNILEDACDWLTGNLNYLKPIDYYNFLRFVQLIAKFNQRRFDNNFVTEDLSPFRNYVHGDVINWFMKKFDTLEHQEFFEILIFVTNYVMLHKLIRKATLRLDDAFKIVRHGTKIVENNSETATILQMLYTVELFSKNFSETYVFTQFSQRLIEASEKREIAANLYDLYHSLHFLSLNETPRPKSISNRAVFRRHANGNFAAWKWLRNSIEMVFNDESYSYMREMAAVAAVRAYKWKAVDFSADDVDRFLNLAAKPYQSHSTKIFAPRTGFSMKTVQRLTHLIVAIRSAAISDLPRLGKLSVRLDDAFWKKFFEIVENEAPELGNRASLLYSLNPLFSIKPSLTPDELPFVTLPSRELQKLLKNLQMRYI